MFNAVSTLTGINPNYAPTMVRSSLPIASLSNYKTDRFTPTASYTALSGSPPNYPISQIIPEDPAAASKFSKWFIGSSNTMLKLGSNWLGKFFVNLVAGNIPIFTSTSVSTQISNNVNLWVGRSDLVRANVTPYQAMLLQDVAIKNINDLSVVTNPNDQAVLAQMVNAASVTRGQPIFVDQPTVASWVATAQTLPKYF
jgi:hypothetical protein